MQPAAEPESEMFVTSRVGVLHASDCFHTLEELVLLGGHYFFSDLSNPTL